MLAGQDFGRRHQGGLAACLCRPCHGEQGNHGLAGADVALQQAQHAVRLAEIVEDLTHRLLLRAGQRVGKGVADLCHKRPVARERPARQAARLHPDQCQSQLAGEKLVISEPPPGHAGGRDVEGIGGIMDRAQRIGEGREPLAAQEFWIEPFGKVGQAGDGLADGAAQELRRQARRQRIDRFQQRQARGLSDVDDMVGMNH